MTGNVAAIKYDILKESVMRYYGCSFIRTRCERCV